MPWTFSHPAVVFPLKQSKIGKYLNLPALIIGSVSPDLFYSVGLFDLSKKAHHFVGWFYTAFPLCIILFIIFSILSKPLEKILPIPCQTYKQWSFLNGTIIILSLFIGAATHILWDGFTHETGSFVRNIQILQYNLLGTMTNGQELRIYKILQLLGSIFGLLYLCLKYKQYQQKLDYFEQKENRKKLHQLVGIILISLGITFPYAFYLAKNNIAFNINKFAFHELRIAELVFFVLVLVLALWTKYHKNNIINS